MPSIGARITEEQLEALKAHCRSKNMTVSDLIVEAVEQVLDGKIRLMPKPSKGTLRCSDCGFPLLYASKGKEGPHVFCLRCGWWAAIKLPRDKWHQGEFEI